MAPPLVFGIDLGTTNSCIALVEDGQPRVIENFEDSESKIMPSNVLYEEDDVVVGKTAKESDASRNMIYEVKRLMGVKHKDVEDEQYLTYLLSQTDLGDLRIKLTVRGNVVYKSPIEVSSDILKTLVGYACDKLGVAPEEGIKAVVAVPAYFNHVQREATKRAAFMAGIEVLKLMNEPTAAALNYAYNQNVTKNNLLIYDLGGGTFDVCLVGVDGNSVEVKATNGDTRLGGKDFDNCLVAHLVQKIKAVHGADVSNDKMSLRRLKAACEREKEKLSSKSGVHVVLSGLQGKHQVDVAVTRSEFESLIAHHLRRTIDIVATCIDDSGIDKADVEEVLLVGGSSKVPAVAASLREFFGKDVAKKPKKPEEAVAKGAAIQAALLTENPETTPFRLTEVVPFSLGIATKGGLMSFLVKKNSPVPSTVIKRYTTSRDNQESIEISVFQGESPQAGDNVFVGQFRIDDLTPSPAREVKIDVKMEVDPSGLLNVTAVEHSRGLTRGLRVELREGHTRFQKSDDASIDFVKLKNNVIGYCQEIVRLAKGDGHYETRMRYREVIRWVESVGQKDVRELEWKLKEVKEDYVKMRQT